MNLVQRLNVYVNMDEVRSISSDLAKQIRTSYSPDIVVCIAKGGVMPGIEISKELGLPLFPMAVARNYDISNVYSFLPKPLAELYQMFLFFTENPVIIKGVRSSILKKRVLLVDDVVHTGKTFNVAKNELKQQNPLEMKTAALSFVGGRKPDFFVRKGRFQYPWSKNAHEFSSFSKYVEQAGIIL